MLMANTWQRRHKQALGVLGLGSEENKEGEKKVKRGERETEWILHILETIVLLMGSLKHLCEAKKQKVLMTKRSVPALKRHVQ